MLQSERTYLPAAGHAWFLPLYDPLTRLFGFDGVRRALLEQAGLRGGHRVLDIGCGTGTLAVLIKRMHPDVDVVALDPDPKALARAQRKARRASVWVRFHRGFADALGYPDATFDRVFSSLMLHHLETDEKPRALAEIHRVLRPGGRLELVDFASPGTHGGLARLVHAHHRLKENSGERILALMTGAGFANARSVRRQTTLFASLEFLQALRL